MSLLSGQKSEDISKKVRFSPRMILSKSLIAILLLLSPLTFSTDTVPNFQPDGETGSYNRARTSVRVAITDRSVRIIPQAGTAPPQQAIITVTILPPHSNLFFPTGYSRPPPHATPCA